MPREGAPVPKKKGQHLLALVAQILSGSVPCAHQIANGLVDLIRHPDRGQLARSQYPRQRHGAASVGLHVITRALWHQRGSEHITSIAEGAVVAVKPMAGRARLIAAVQGLVLALKLAQQPLNRSRRGLDLAEIAHLSLSAALCDSHGVLDFR